MACGTCFKNKDNIKNGGYRQSGGCGNCSSDKLTVFNWLAGISDPSVDGPAWVEVRFKNSRKNYYINPEKLPVKEGDVVAVEAQTGHDIGVVSLTGPLVLRQMARKNIAADEKNAKKIYRIARQKDIDIWQEAIKLEESTKKRAREIAASMGLVMKINDVEYQGDKTKATFYYTAEGRVDFRELIKVYAREFKVKIEMRQIGMRQEAAMLGGIGSCGRELCCSSWLTDFRSVNTQAARYQQLAFNPSKLTGQCGKLKCCLNYELDQYVEALNEFPDTEIKLQTKAGTAVFQKLDVFKKKMWYAYEHDPYNFIELDLNRVKEIIELNKKNIIPDQLKELTSVTMPEDPGFTNVVGQDSVDRFDKKNKRKKKKRSSNRNKGNKQ